MIFLLVARLLNLVAGVARSRSIEADERRGEADLAAALARVLGRSDGLRSALPGASGCVAQALACQGPSLIEARIDRSNYGATLRAVRG